MAREIYYQRQMQGAGIGMPSMPRVLDAGPGASNATAGLVKQGLDVGQDILKAYVPFHQKQQENLIEEANLAAHQRMELWKAEYDRTHQGGNALEAQHDYMRQWGEITSGLRDAYKDKLDNVYMHKFERKMMLGSIYSIAEGAKYQQQQQKLWDASLDEASQKQMLLGQSMYGASDPARAQMMWKEYAEGLQARHPGVDMSGKLIEAGEQAKEAQFNAMVNAGDYDGAEKFIKNWFPADAGGSEGRIVEGGVRHGGTIARDHNNPLNQKWPQTKTKKWNNTRGDFFVYDSMESGLRGNWNLLKDYKNKYGRKTLRTMISNWAPKSDNNDTDAYMNYVSKSSGIGLDAEVDINDPHVAAKVMHAMAVREDHKLGEELTVERIENALRNQGNVVPVKRDTMYVAYDKPEGMVEQGNIDIANRPQVKMEDGSTATVRSMSFEMDGKQVLVPTVSDDGRIMSDDEAIAEYKKTGKHLGKFDSVEAANKYAQGLHEQQDNMYVQEPDISSRAPKYRTYYNIIQSARKERRQELRLTKEDFANHIAYGMDGQDEGKFEQATKDVESLRQLGFHEEAAELEKSVNLAKSAYAFSRSTSGSLLDRQAQALKGLNNLITPDNAKHAKTVRDSVVSAFQKQIDDFMKDPAAVSMSQPSVTKAQSVQEGITRSLEAQSELGKGLIYQPRMLPKEVAEGMRANFDKIKDGMEMADFLLGLQKTYGPYTEGVLSEMKIPSGVAVVLPALGSMPRKDLGVFVMGMTARGSDIPKVEADELDAMKQAIGSEFELLNITREFARLFPNNKDIQGFFNSLTRGGFNYLKLTGKDNFDNIDNAFSMSGDNKCFILLPSYSGVKASDVSSALGFFRESGLLREDFEKRGFSKDYEKGKMHRVAASNLEQMFSDGIFVSTADGKHAVLIDPSTEQPFKKKNGEVYMVDFDTVLKKYKGYSE